MQRFILAVTFLLAAHGCGDTSLSSDGGDMHDDALGARYCQVCSWNPDTGRYDRNCRFMNDCEGPLPGLVDAQVPACWECPGTAQGTAACHLVDCPDSGVTR
jgi:hypothetical protein